MTVLKVMSVYLKYIIYNAQVTCRALLEGLVFELDFDDFCIIDFKFLEPVGWMKRLEELSADLSKEKTSD